MSSSSQTFYADAAIDKWFFRDPQKNKVGGLSVFIKQNEMSKRDVSFRIGEVDPATGKPTDAIPFAPFGLYAPRDNKERRCLELAFTDPAVIKFWKDVDTRVFQEAMKQSTKWFGRAPSEDKLRSMYIPILREPTEEFVNLEGRTVPAKPWHTVRATIMDTSDWERTDIFIASYGEDGSLQYTEGSVADGIPRGSLVMPIYRLSSMRFTRSEFNLALKYKSLLVWPGAEEAKGINQFGLPIEVGRMSAEDAELHRQNLQSKVAAEGERELQ